MFSIIKERSSKFNMGNLLNVATASSVKIPTISSPYSEAFLFKLMWP